MSAVAQRIVFQVSLPPPSLRANSRSHWATKKKDADTYSAEVYWHYREQVGYKVMGWKQARATFTWFSCGVQPDHSNLGGNTKYLQDILCMAPTTKAGKDRFYLGIVEDDAGITAEYTSVRVKKKAEECVLIEITQA